MITKKMNIRLISTITKNEYRIKEYDNEKNEYTIKKHDNKKYNWGIW